MSELFELIGMPKVQAKWSQDMDSVFVDFQRPILKFGLGSLGSIAFI